jgi:hypothetical protein
MLDHPYFGTLASALKLEKNNELLIFSSDEERMTYNSEYVEKLEITVQSLCNFDEADILEEGSCRPHI